MRNDSLMYLIYIENVTYVNFAGNKYGLSYWNIVEIVLACKQITKKIYNYLRSRNSDFVSFLECITQNLHFRIGVPGNFQVTLISHHNVGSTSMSAEY